MAILQGGSYLATVTSATDLTGSTISLAVTAPDGTLLPEPPIDVDGDTASAVVAGQQVGTYLLVWTVTGGSPDVVQDQFTVEAPSLDLLSLTDLRDELNLADAYTLEDGELRRMLRAARGVVENVTGPIIPTVRTVQLDGGGTYIVLPDQWVVSVASIIETTSAGSRVLTEQPVGTATDGYGYTWDRGTGVVTRRGYGGSPTRFSDGIGNLAVTYTAGLATIPQDVQQATARLIEHWWRKQHNASRSSGMFTGAAADDAGVSMVGNYEIPNAAMELLEPWRRSPGMA